MNFIEAKDELLKWLVPALLSFMCVEIYQLAGAMIEVKELSKFTNYRVDQHRDAIKSLQEKQATSDIVIGQLKIKVFGR